MRINWKVDHAHYTLAQVFLIAAEKLATIAM
jgi:hypothetical protein